MDATTPFTGRPSRRRTHRTYFIRRVCAAVVLVALMYAGSAGLQSLFGGTDGLSLATSSSASAEAATLATVMTVATASPPTPISTTVAPTTTLPDAGITPTAADPARVYIAGDSDAGAFAPFLEKLLGQTGVVKTRLEYKSSSGLARPDFFDWPARLMAQLPKINPDIVVVTFGGNDGQPIHGLNKQVDSQEWRAEYGKRVGAVMDLLGADGRTLIWVGIPNDADPITTAHLKIQDEVVRRQVDKHPGVVFIDSWHIFAGLDGGYAEFVVDPRDGVSKRVRSDTDGFHLNTTGAEILALDIAEAVERDLRNRGADL